MATRTAFLTLLSFHLAISAASAREVASLFETGEVIALGRVETDGGGVAAEAGRDLVLGGPGGGGPVSFVIHPPDGTWDFSAWNHLRVDFTNTGERLARITGRINNPGGQGYMPGTAIVPRGGNGSLGFTFVRPDDGYDGPEIFRSQSARPNGHRRHWRSFDPRDVIALRITVHATGPFALRLAPPVLCWPYGSAANADLEQVPYLDRFGQLRALNWPGKVSSDAELRAALDAEGRAARANPAPGFNRFGGWADGPRQEATGFFRTAKIDGRWWLVDPEGALFWSHGANSVGRGVHTPRNRSRLPLFEWLPEENDPLYGAIMMPGRGNGPPGTDFLTGNLARAFGPGCGAAARSLHHDRMRAWGINTMGAWSDNAMFAEARTPYTHMIHVWHANLAPAGSGYFPDPFEPGYEERIRRAVGKFADTANDPWCLGVFIENEINWTSDFAPWLFRVPARRPIKSAFVEHLTARHGDIAGLNRAWGTSLDRWRALKSLSAPPEIGPGHKAAFAKDVDVFYETLADRYYLMCARVMRELMPNHLYLGSRVHRGPSFVLEAAARHADVFSSNEYAFTIANPKLPVAIDVPVIIGEFHFGAPDRGVPGTGLCGVNDQTQRALAYQAYLASALMDRRVVGAHWFAFADQSAAGRPGENYQIGIIDITGRAYPEFTSAVRRVSGHLYRIRANPPPSVEAALERMTGR